MANLRREVHVLRQKASKVQMLEAQNAQLHLLVARLEQENITLKDAVVILRKRLTEFELRTVESATRISECQRRASSTAMISTATFNGGNIVESNTMRNTIATVRLAEHSAHEDEPTHKMRSVSGSNNSQGRSSTGGISSRESQPSSSSHLIRHSTDHDDDSSSPILRYPERVSVAHNGQWILSPPPVELRPFDRRTPSPPPAGTSIDNEGGGKKSLLRTPPRRLFVTRPGGGGSQPLLAQPFMQPAAVMQQQHLRSSAPVATPSTSASDVEVSAISSLFSPPSAARAQNASITSISPRRDRVPSPQPLHRASDMLTSPSRARLHHVYLAATAAALGQPTRASSHSVSPFRPVAPSRLTRSVSPPTVRQAVSVSPRGVAAASASPEKSGVTSRPPPAPVTRTSARSFRPPLSFSGRSSPAAFSDASLEEEFEEGIQRKLAMSFW